MRSIRRASGTISRGVDGLEMGASTQIWTAAAAEVRQEVLDAVLLARIAPGATLTRAEFASRSRARPAEAAQALEILAAMGLASVEGDRVSIAPVRVEDVLRHVERRMALEIAIVRAAAQRATDVQLSDMRESERLQSRCALVGDMDGLMSSERHLERLLVEASGLHDEGEELRSIKVEFRRAWCALNRLRTFTHVANIRTALISAIAARDPDAAEAQTRVFFDHLIRSY
jgi:DNA-binding GntR family transcriptional regulator